ncbi:MAG: flagellar hook-basal body complex protein FliE [Alphaproteobacteria bacterium]|nr:flagellar hook-basal body complex protein FliE [Alphaproteobacteria bacterium]
MVDKIIDPNIAANAYANNRNLGKSGGMASGDDGVSFSDFLRQKAVESVDTLKKSEEMSAKAITGEADLTDVVTAVTNAELTLQTVVSVRDRLISAYQEIMRMPI